MALYEGSAAELLQAGAGGGQGLTGALRTRASVLGRRGKTGYVLHCIDKKTLMCNFSSVMQNLGIKTVEMYQCGKSGGNIDGRWSNDLTV